MFNANKMLLVAFTSFALLGCSGSSDQPKLGRVTGVVTFEENPLPNAEIHFLPETGRGSAGMTDSNGRYSLRYTEKHNGAVIGTHSVSITTKLPDDTSKPEILPAKYNQKSELTFQVKEGDNVADFSLTSK